MNPRNRTFINSGNINAPPAYKPPPEIQELLDRQGAQRRRTVQLPKRSWVQRNPRLFQVIVVTSCLLSLFSKPIYDIYTEYRLSKKFKELEKLRSLEALSNE